MQLRAVLAKIGIGVSLIAGLMTSGPASAALTKGDIDRSLARCSSSANYNGEVYLCMIDAYSAYHELASRRSDKTLYSMEIYKAQLDACDGFDDKRITITCALAAVKFYLHDGDIVQYMSDGKYNTDQ